MSSTGKYTWKIHLQINKEIKTSFFLKQEGNKTGDHLFFHFLFDHFIYNKIMGSQIYVLIATFLKCKNAKYIALICWVFFFFFFRK